MIKRILAFLAFASLVHGQGTPTFTTVNGLTLTAGTNTFTITRGTATLTLGAAGATNITALSALGTTKGDVAIYNGTGWVRVGAGANDTVLTADSAQASGVKWAAGGGTPGGIATQVQYNNAGAFGGITGATTNGTVLTLVAPVLGVATATSVVLDGTSGTTPGAGQVTLNGSLGNFSIIHSSGRIATFQGSSLTGSRTYTLPNAAGTLALTSDITGGSLAGTFTVLTATSYLILGDDGPAGTAGAIYFKNATSTGNTILGNANTSASNYTATLPAATGTVTLNETVSGGTLAGSFTTLAASGAVSGTGFANYLAAPPAIGGTTPAAGSFTTLSATTTFAVTNGLSMSGGITPSNLFPNLTTFGLFGATGEGVKFIGDGVYTGVGNKVTGAGQVSLLLFTNNTTQAEITHAGAFLLGGVAVPTISSTSTLTNKSIGLATNTVTTTMALLNTAVSDGDVAFVGAANTFTLGQGVTVGTNSATPATAATLLNSTAAIAGTQSASPAIIQTGQGWKTTATAASQSVNFKSFVLPVQGTTAPTGVWKLQADINGGGYIDIASVSSVGLLTIPNIAGSGIVAPSLTTNTGNVLNLSAVTDVAITSGKFRVGTQTSAVAALESQATTEQLRLQYSSGNDARFQVSSAGLLTITSTGASAGVSFTGTLAVTGTTALTGNLTSNGAYVTTPQALTYSANPTAISVATQCTALTTTSTGNAFSLANGTNGQIKTIVLDVKTGGGDTAVITPATASGYTTITLFAVGDTVTLQYFTTRGWMVIGSRNATIAAVARVLEQLALCA